MANLPHPICLTGREPVAAFVARNCQKKRVAVVEALIRAGLKVHTLGTCKVSGAEPHTIGRGGVKKVEALASYAAYLAFENSEADDYVSEKVCPH